MRKVLPLLLSLIGLTFAIYWVVSTAKKQPVAPPLREPARNSYNKTIAGSGIIEAAGRNIGVAPQVSGQVVQLFVKENDAVKKGDKLLQLDDQEQRARINSASANIERADAAIRTAQADIETQNTLLMGARANLDQLTALLADNEEVLKSNETLYKNGVIPFINYNSSLKTRDAAKARVDQAQAQIMQVETQVISAKARLKETQENLKVLQAQREELKVALDRLTLKAPSDGRILQMNIKVGEYVNLASTTAPILLGETEELQVRVDVDEINASRVTAGTPAKASLKGDANRKIPLSFVRIDPYIVPKKSLTGDNSERVDIRVLQVIYRFAPPDFPVYVGQQVDVFIDASPVTEAKVNVNAQ